MDLLPGRIGYHPNEFSPILSNISCPVEFDRARNTAQNELKFMDLLPIRPGMKYCSNWVEIHGFTPNSTGHKLLVKLGGNSLRLHHHLMKNKNKVTQYI